jgi:hypothetical protein
MKGGEDLLSTGQEWQEGGGLVRLGREGSPRVQWWDGIGWSCVAKYFLAEGLCWKPEPAIYSWALTFATVPEVWAFGRSPKAESVRKSWEAKAERTQPLSVCPTSSSTLTLPGGLGH